MSNDLSIFNELLLETSAKPTVDALNKGQVKTPEAVTKAFAELQTTGGVTDTCIEASIKTVDLQNATPETVKALVAAYSKIGVPVDTLFLMAYHEGNFALAQKLIETKAFNPDKHGGKALRKACQNGIIGAVRALLHLKPDLANNVRINGEPLALELAKKKEYGTLELLMRAGADPHATNRKGLTLWKHALKKEDAKLVALILNVTPSKAKTIIAEYQLRNKLGHLFRIKESDFPKGVASELGSHKAEMIPVAKEALEGEYPTLDKALDRALAAEKENASASLKAAERGDLLLLPLGFPGHAMYLVVKTMGDETILMVANAGAALPENGKTITAWKIDPKRLTPELIKKLFDLKEKGTEEEVATFYYVELPILLGAERTSFTEKVETLSPSMQKMGNCAWEALKAALRAGYAVEEASYGNGNWGKEALAMSKKMSANARITGAAEYLFQHKQLWGPSFSHAHATIAINKTKKHAAKFPELTKTGIYKFVCQQDAVMSLSKGLSDSLGLTPQQAAKWIFQ